MGRPVNKCRQAIVERNRVRRREAAQRIVDRMIPLLLKNNIDRRLVQRLVGESRDAVGPRATAFLLDLSKGYISRRDLRHRLRIFVRAVGLQFALPGFLPPPRSQLVQITPPASAVQSSRPAPAEPQAGGCPGEGPAVVKPPGDPDTPPQCPAEWLVSEQVQAMARRVAGRVGLPISREGLWRLMGTSASRLSMPESIVCAQILAGNVAMVDRMVADIVYYLTGRPELPRSPQRNVGAATLPAEARWCVTWKYAEGLPHSIETRRQDGHPLIQLRRDGVVVAEVLYVVESRELHQIVDVEFTNAAEASEYEEWFEWLRDKLGQV